MVIFILVFQSRMFDDLINYLLSLDKKILSFFEKWLHKFQMKFGINNFQICRSLAFVIMLCYLFIKNNIFLGIISCCIMVASSFLFESICKSNEYNTNIASKILLLPRIAMLAVLHLDLICLLLIIYSIFVVPLEVILEQPYIRSTPDFLLTVIFIYLISVKPLPPVKINMLSLSDQRI